jgi:hypothetical protein
MKYTLVIIVSLFLLLAAIFSLPYGYYVYLRIIVCAFSLYCTYHLIDIYDNKVSIYIIPIMVAILFNPIIRIHLDREIWKVVDLAIIALVWYPYIYKKFRDKID